MSVPEKVRSVKGFSDVLPAQSALWNFVEEAAAEVFSLYGFSRIWTPSLEFSDIYKRAIGGSTDLVEKEMYCFRDRDGSELTLRPEGTAGVVRAFVENSLHCSAPALKVFYSGEMFRRERPQKGRARGFHQIGAEFFGSPSASADCEVMAMLWHFFRKIGLSEKIEMEINSIGSPEDRTRFKTALAKFLKPFETELCDDCSKRREKNPLRIVDCKNRACRKIVKSAPVIGDFLSPENARHFDEVRENLTALCVPFTVNEKIVRGLDYYTRTVFEAKARRGLGAQNAVAAGGRYDLLVETLGGPPTPATGFAIGVERTVILLEEDEKGFAKNRPDVFVGWIGEGCFSDAFLLSAELRERAASVLFEHSPSAIRSQMKKADRSGAALAAIIGPEESRRGVVKIRDMMTGDERDLPRGRAAEGICASLKISAAGG